MVEMHVPFSPCNEDVVMEEASLNDFRVETDRSIRPGLAIITEEPERVVRLNGDAASALKLMPLVGKYRNRRGLG